MVWIEPVTSLAVIGVASAGGTEIRAASSVFGAEELFDCFSTGVGDIIEGGGAAGAVGIAGIAGLALLSAGAGAGACTEAAGSLECSNIGRCSTLPVSSSV